MSRTHRRDINKPHIYKLGGRWCFTASLVVCRTFLHQARAFIRHRNRVEGNL